MARGKRALECSMARLTRLCVPGELHHVRVQGNNHQDIASAPEDFAHLHALWVRESDRHGVKVHAYVFLPNCVNVILSPTHALGLTQCMQAIGRVYVAWYNRKYSRTGTLWQGRFRSTVLASETWLLPSMVYLDWAPVRAGLVEQVGAYGWSSHSHYIGQQRDPLIESPEGIWRLGNTPFARESQYAEMVQLGLTGTQVVQISKALDSGWPLGGEEFVAKLQSQTSRRLSPMKPGRPKKSPSLEQ